MWINAPYFCAGVDIVDGKVVRAAPIIKYMIGWSAIRVADYCRRKGWECIEA